MKKSKNITLKTIYKLRFSPEIEAVFPIKVDIEKLHDRYQKFLRGWTVTHDNSLVVKNQISGLEFKPKKSHHLKFNEKTFDEITDICNIIRGKKGRINFSCGGHIHIDMSKFTTNQIIKIIKRFITLQYYIVKKFRVRRWRLENHCRYIPKSTIKLIKTSDVEKLIEGNTMELPGYDIYNEKHLALNILNLNGFRTLEFRFFEGTLKADEIKRRVEWLFNFIYKSLQ